MTLQTQALRRARTNEFDGLRQTAAFGAKPEISPHASIA